ncbi:MAG: hypothetical protein ACJ734_10765, partial [Gaiellaceae bacterium]
TFSAARRGRCGTVVATVGGASVAAVRFTVNGRPGPTDVRAPFRLRYLSKARVLVRARVATRFDQVVTSDRTVRACR